MKFRKLFAGGVVCIVSLAFAGEARAAQPPELISVSHQTRHPTAEFSAGGTNWATMYVATAPELASDGHFFSENVVVIDFLGGEEIRAGRWVYSERLAPGTYYVMVRAVGLDCWENPNCIDGSSNVMGLTITNVVPTLDFMSIEFKTVRPSWYGLGYVRVSARFRVCDDVDGDLRVHVEEQRIKGDRLLARSRWSRTLVLPGQCAIRTIHWRLARKFVLPGLGRYVVSLQVRDKDGGVSREVSKLGFIS